MRTLKTAVPTALAIIGMWYLLVNVAYFSVVPLQEMESSGEFVAALFFQRIFGEEVGRLLLLLFVAVSAAGSVMVSIFATGSFLAVPYPYSISS